MQMHSLRLIVTVTHVGGDATAVADGDVGNHCVDFGFCFSRQVGYCVAVAVLQLLGLWFLR